MIQQVIIPNQKMVNLSFEVPQNYVGKPMRVNINLENVFDFESEKPMSNQEFVKWIADAENAPTMTLDTFNKKWKAKKQELLELIP